MNINSKELLMYQFLIQISSTNAPIVFKGGLVTKLILGEKNFSVTNRHTKDIDANWIGTPPTMNELVDTINNSLGELQKSFFVKAHRDYSENTSAGLTVYEKTSDTLEKVITIDMDILPVSNSRNYFMGTASIKGVLSDEILADKISAISTDKIYKFRTKDLIDIYCLSHCVQVNAKNIFEMCRKSKHSIEDFYDFYNNKNAIEHAYNRLKNIEGKPPFETVYQYISKFIKPFVERSTLDMTWDCQSSSWRTETLQQTKKLGKNPVLKTAEYQRKHREPSVPTVTKDNIKKKKNSLE